MEQRNLILAIVVSMVILIAFNYLYPTPPVPPAPEEAIPAGVPPPAPSERVPEIPSASPPAPAELPAPPRAGTPVGEPTVAAPRRLPSAGEGREAVLAQTARIRIDSPLLRGSISLAGGRIDDLELVGYRETLKPGSPHIVLLTPPGGANPYYATFGWLAEEPGVAVPDIETVWRADRETLTPGAPVTLTWENGQGLRFTRTIALDESYLFTVTQRVESAGAAATLYPYAFVSRTGTPEVTRFIILHEGLLGVFDGALKEVKYKDIREDREVRRTSTGGWIGITDKYWLTALLPDQNSEAQYRFSHRIDGGEDKYQVDVLGPGRTVAPGTGVEAESHLFAGAKVVRILDGYESALGATGFDRAVDFGWFYFLTKPLFYVLHYFNDLLGNFGLAILLLTVLIKAVFYPLANKSYRAMSRVKKLAPEVERLREQFKDDRQRQSQEMMKMYKEQGVNPLSGCLPIAVQIPVFFALYKVLFVTIEMRQAPFFGWIQDLSAPDPLGLLTLFGLIPWEPSGFLTMVNVGIWPLVMGATMYLQQKISPQAPDPTQAKVMMALPVVFTFLLARFPAGLVIYWAWNNLLSIAQQWFIMRQAARA